MVPKVGRLILCSNLLVPDSQKLRTGLLCSSWWLRLCYQVHLHADSGSLQTHESHKLPKFTSLASCPLKGPDPVWTRCSPVVFAGGYSAAEVIAVSWLYFDDAVCLQRSNDRRYLLCPAYLSVSVLKKFIHVKFELSTKHHVRYFCFCCGSLFCIFRQLVTSWLIG